jgi:hypothetical protein
MQKILIDGRQLVTEALVKVGNNLNIPFHDAMSLSLNCSASLAKTIAEVGNGTTKLALMQPLESLLLLAPETR